MLVKPNPFFFLGVAGFVFLISFNVARLNFARIASVVDFSTGKRTHFPFFNPNWVPNFCFLPHIIRSRSVAAAYNQLAFFDPRWCPFKARRFAF